MGHMRSIRKLQGGRKRTTCDRFPPWCAGQARCGPDYDVNPTGTEARDGSFEWLIASDKPKTFMLSTDRAWWQLPAKDLRVFCRGARLVLP